MKSANDIYYSMNSGIWAQHHRDVKVVFLGESNVGKTCLVTRYMLNTFNKNESYTTGAAFTSKSEQYGGNSFKFQIWDTAGQEVYRSLAPLYYRDAAAAILVYDISEMDSFRGLTSFWINEMEKFGPQNVVLIVIGNKSDLDKRAITTEEGKSFAEIHKAHFLETSALTGENVDQIFPLIAKYLPPLVRIPYVEHKIKLEQPPKTRRKCCNTTGRK